MYRPRRPKKKSVPPVPLTPATRECDCVIKIGDIVAFECGKQITKDKSFKVMCFQKRDTMADEKKQPVQKMKYFCGPWHYVMFTSPWSLISECEYFSSAEKIKVANDWSKKHGDTSWPTVLAKVTTILEKTEPVTIISDSAPVLVPDSLAAPVATSVAAPVARMGKERKQKIIDLDATLFR